MMRLSVQLYTLRNPLAVDLKGTLQAVADMGIEYVELAGLGGLSASEYRAVLDECNLTASGAHVSVPILESDLDAVIADANTLGYSHIICPWVGKDMYSQGWDLFGQRLDAIGAKLSEAGFTFSYHNHDFEFDGGDNLAVLYANASPENLSAEIDCAWIGLGGYDPLTYISNMGSRVVILHLKNYNPDSTPRWTAAGEGIIDYAPIVAWGEENGIDFGVIELDESPGDPLESVRASAEYLMSLGLK